MYVETDFKENVCEETEEILIISVEKILVKLNILKRTKFTKTTSSHLLNKLNFSIYAYD